MFQTIIRHIILRKFFAIELSNSERELATATVATKYTPVVRTSLAYSFLLLPALFLLDTQIVLSVLMPTTMVAGTAWFAVSLASMKKKFERFGNELTRDLFTAFTLSLCMLFLAATVSLTREYWIDRLSLLPTPPWIPALSALLGIVVVGRLLFAIFLGSLKYDINDAMLTGQNEAAERFFKKSLSLLHLTSETLRNNRSLQVANYSIGVAFYEVFSSIKGMEDDASLHLDALLERANMLITNPGIDKAVADQCAIHLAEQFARFCRLSAPEVAEHKSFIAIKDEIECLKNNTNEVQEMVDVRMSVVFQEMSTLLEEFGERLFQPHIFQ